MTEYLVRTELTAALNVPADSRLLDWAPGSTSATIQFGNRAGSEFFTGWRAPREALDLFLLGAALYCADKTTLRSPSVDVWTRDISIKLPVQDESAWRDAHWDKTLNFLTGDQWTITPYAGQGSPLKGVRLVPDDVTPVGAIDAVSLFSGGLDSLTGVIDLLEEDPDRRLCLISHNEGDQASTAQKKLLNKLRSRYGGERLHVRRLFLRPAPATRQQARPLPEYRETTTRSRSMLFLTAGLALAASVGPDVPVYIPENGFIGINVPLTRSRSGSYSTRTTHPYFIDMLQRAAREVGVGNPILNPFRLQTKGEILAGSRNPGLLKELAPDSISCSHPEAARYAGRQQGNCGYCFPCLIRRSSMAYVGWDGPAGYAWDALSGKGLLDRDTRRAADLRAVINGVYADRPDRDVLRNGPTPNGEHRDFLRVWRGGIAELRSWFDGATGETERLIRGLK
ncbi:Qat anti-phage system QueC-like protein QatC [Pseudarthrobacter sp. NPDC058329]|uniref:Qat anti-phage system QueC-like protein QatC n=1 Tax=Pseudarthrobacter sp. NPDC058329 TaxID=3346448 RepID=UPI0036DC5DC9